MINTKTSFSALLTAGILALGITACSSMKQVEDNRRAEEVLASMTTKEKIAQLFVLRIEQLDLTITPEQAHAAYDNGRKSFSRQMKSTFSAYPVGGFCIFGKNIKSKSQLKKLNHSINSLSPVRPIIAIDEEGGRVARLAKTESLEINNVGPMEDVGKTGEVEKAFEAGAYIGSYLHEYGFTIDFAPVADVNTNPDNIVIGNRSFGSDPHLVAKMDSAFLSGLHSSGMKGCLKHFPGHGDTAQDTHADYVGVTKNWQEIVDCELIPFKENFHSADCVMVAHVSFTNVDKDYPASLSKKLISEKLRGELGYKGIILTDALDMGAIEKNYGSAEAAVLAFEAGNDILLMPKDFIQAYKGMLEAVNSGRISMERLDESVLRILSLKGYK